MIQHIFQSLLDWFNQNFILGTIILLMILTIIVLLIDKATFLDKEK